MPPALPGKTLLNQYRIDEFIAQTPLGDLYRATDIRVDRPLALTHLPASISESIEALKTLEAGWPKQREIVHPNITPYLGIFQTPTLAFLLEEWTDGPSLREIFEKGPATVDEAFVYLRVLCSALEMLHRRGYLHLNLAPELVRVNKQGVIRLSGIALARPSDEAIFKSYNSYSPLYRAPEQFLGEALTTASDTYALAVLLYQLVTGTWINGKSPPKTGDAIRKTHLEGSPPSPVSRQKEIPDHFARMLLWALRKKPDERLKTTTELLTSLALGARKSVDKVPLRADPRTAPVTWSVISEWQFLPPPKQNMILQDATPLEDRLAALDPEQPKKRRRTIGVLPAFLLIMFAGIASLFWFVRPAPVAIATPVQFTPFVASEYTPPPVDTAVPRPTSEHGGRIVFTCTRGDFNQLCMVHRDGTGFAQLTNMEASNYYPTFSPDGGALLFASNRSGQLFDLFLLRFDEKEFIQLTQHVGNVISPDYSPDGRTIVFANRVGEGPTNIWMVNADGLNPRPVYTGVRDIVSTVWSPDGQRIAYAMSEGTLQDYAIYIMDANGRNHLRVSRGLRGIGGSIDWSPDGKYLLVYAGPFDNKDIFRIEAGNGDFIRLTDGGNNAGAVYSPDGRYIVFNSMRNDDQADLYIMRADGTNQVQLTNHPEPDWGAQWAQ
jgi:Tol biopolymer transport system component/serine/threonine protein kinase